MTKSKTSLTALLLLATFCLVSAGVNVFQNNLRGAAVSFVLSAVLYTASTVVYMNARHTDDAALLVKEPKAPAPTGQTTGARILATVLALLLVASCAVGAVYEAVQSVNSVRPLPAHTIVAQIITAGPMFYGYLGAGFVLFVLAGLAASKKEEPASV